MDLSLSYAGRSAAVTLDTFRSGFAIEDFIDRLCRDVLSESELGEEPSSRGRGSNPTPHARDALDKVRKLLDHFKRCESQLRTLHEKVTSQLHEAQEKLDIEQNHFGGVVGVVESELEQSRDEFKDLDKRMGNFSRMSTRIGERLKRANERQERARDALELIEYLQAFSFVPTDGDFSCLPAIFIDDSRLSEAAAVAQRLLALSSELRSAKERVGIEGESCHMSGTLEYAVSKLETYCNALENRIVLRFDNAVHADDRMAMGECAHIMAELNREMALAQRYISSRPMFMDVKELRFGETSPWQSSAMAIRDLQAMYREILVVVKHEAQVIEVVFPSSCKAMQVFLQRVMEQRVRAALDRILQAPGTEADCAELRSYARLVSEVYEKTHTLAVNLERVTKDQLDLVDLADSLFVDFLGNYPKMELKWMSGMYERQEANDVDGALNAHIVSIFSEWNKEAVMRCKILSPDSQLAHHVRQLFHSSTYYHANVGCLLEQVARHTMRGLERARELCVSGSTAALSSSSLGGVSKKAIEAAANDLVANGIGHVLKSVYTTSQVINDLEGYTSSVIRPLVASSVAESATCNSGLASLIRAVEERTLENLNNGVKLFFMQVEKVLVAEQKRNEFRPSGGVALAFDQPTIACKIVCGLLEALLSASQTNLEGPNLMSFLEEVGCQAHDCLSNHLTRFTFSPFGALKLKRDMAEYMDTALKFNCPDVTQQFDFLQQLVNVFIVAPESLIGLVDGTLRMSHKDAMRFVQLREDFKTARVEGQTLGHLFTSAIEGFD